MNLFTPRRTRVRLIVKGVIGLADISVIFLSFTLVSLLYRDAALDAQTSKTLALVIPVFVGIAISNGAYTTSVVERLMPSLYKTLTAFLFAVGISILAVFLLKSSESFSRGVFGLGTGVGLIGLTFSRKLCCSIHRHHFGRQFVNELLINHRPPKAIIKPDHVITIDAELEGLVPDPDDHDMMTRIGALVKNADSITVNCAVDLRDAWSFVLKAADVQAQIVYPELDRIGALRIGHFGDSTTLAVSLSPLSLPNRIVKRVFDLAVAVAAVILLAIPMLAIAALIRIDSSGAALFRQTRIGRNNQPFMMLKFRSMATGRQDDAARQLTRRNDERLTRIGAFLRRTSLDELPQILNVLMGDMSIVGPRPHAAQALAGQSLYWQVDNRYWHRHAIKPGMTGLAQIRGHRGNTFREDDLRDRLQSDLDYIAQWSLLSDILIIISTFRVLRHDNAF
ncbi:MAG: sugar transferase [Alphaproteobacteria bacterium]|nr:sugar transferase [Alphaproteobacteria bacterium]